jgi:phytanoyl-CoA hydroxylase
VSNSIEHPSPITISGLWLDAEDAEKQAPGRLEGKPSWFVDIARALIRDGFAIVPSAVSQEDCRGVEADYAEYLVRNAAAAARYVDERGRHHRLVNFHRTSTHAMRIGLDRQIMSLLDYLFGHRAAIYTSLTFEFGTEQPLHRDIPFFWTFPPNYFFGVWFAIEDIDPDAGPLMYVRGAHRFSVDHRALLARARQQHPEASTDVLVNLALESYYGEVAQGASSMGEPVTALLKRGDMAIWHPQMPHGGSRAKDPSRTRKSIVFHCAPEEIQVYQQDIFFAWSSDMAPPPRYGFGEQDGRKYALAGETAFQ